MYNKKNFYIDEISCFPLKFMYSTKSTFVFQNFSVENSLIPIFFGINPVFL